MKKIFNYDENTGLYIGEGIAHTDPETGGALLPRNATTERPPAYNAIFRDGTWHVPTLGDNVTAAPDEVVKIETPKMERSRPPKRRR